MSMVVKNNMSAVKTLNTLNKNSLALQNSLAKVSSGQKINSAKDDSSAYAISQKMRERIRSLRQDNQNVQNGSSLFKIAENGINNIVDELRNLKELAINAANDTNTDGDRKTIQKEFTQKMANINDIATTTNYNGKILLDGTYSSRIYLEKIKLEGPAYTPANLTDSFSASDGTKSNDKTVSKGDKFAVDSSFTTDNSNTQKVSIDFSTLVINPNLSVPTALNGKGFTILCSACYQYINIVFDGTTDKSTYNPDLVNDDPDLSGARQYTIGIKSVKSTADLPKALFDGMASTLTDDDVYGAMPKISSGDVSSLTKTTFLPCACHFSASSAVNTICPHAAPGDAPKPLPATCASFNASSGVKA